MNKAVRVEPKQNQNNELKDAKKHPVDLKGTAESGGFVIVNIYT